MALSLRLNPFGRTLKNAARLRTIVSVFAKHGFHNVAEKVRLGKFIVERLTTTEDIEKLSAPERMRMAFEELGPSFVKLGQLLATRPDLIPEEYALEFQKLHDRVQALPFEVIESVLKEEFGNSLFQKFSHIQTDSVGSASMAQVHKARLISGDEVVIKIQRPGILKQIEDDLNVLYTLAELLYKYLPETRPYNPRAIVDEYFKTLQLETNFVVEANNIRRFRANFLGDENIQIPKVYFELTTERVLCMEALGGIPLSQDESLRQPGIQTKELIRKGLRAYLKMVFIDGLFHGDLHAGNFFVLPDGKVGLIDFGVVGRLNHKTQSAIANMLIALSKEDYERLAHEYVDLAPFTDKVNLDLFAKELRELIAPYYGLTLKNVNLGKLLMSSSNVAARHYLTLPADLMLFFKSIVAVEGIGRRIESDFDFLQYSLEFASEIVKYQYDSNKILGDVSLIARESRNFINSLPRQLNFLVRKLNSPDHAFEIQIREISDLRKSMESSANLLFLGIIIAALILSASLVYPHPTENHIGGIPAMSFILFFLAMIFGVVGFINYIRK